MLFIQTLRARFGFCFSIISLSVEIAHPWYIHMQNISSCLSPHAVDLFILLTTAITVLYYCLI